MKSIPKHPPFGCAITPEDEATTLFGRQSKNNGVDETFVVKFGNFKKKNQNHKLERDYTKCSMKDKIKNLKYHSIASISTYFLICFKNNHRALEH